MPLPIVLNEWESAFFGKKTARLQPGGAFPDKAALEEHCREERIALVQACVDTSDSAAIFALENLGFHFVDLRVFMVCDVRKTTHAIAKNEHIRKSSLADIPQLLAVTHHSFTENSRYQWQDCFSVQQIDGFYDTWLENGVKGTHDDFCLHYQLEDKIAGLTTLKIQDDSAYIGIIAVDSKYRGRGIADALVQNAIAYAKGHNLATVSSATQGKNMVTQNLYAKHGMKVMELQSWYYKKIEGVS